MSNAWQITQTDKHCFELVGDTACNEPFNIMITSDHHWDNAHCDRRLLKNHLQQAKDIDAPIFGFGDTFCAMQGKFDKRADKKSLRPEHRGECYFDELSDTAAEWYGEFADDIAMLSMGNHEESIIRHQQVNLLSRLCDSVNALEGPYWGFIKIRKNPKASPITLMYHHGYGGGGPVTKGMLNWAQMRGAYQADVYVMGHIHHKNLDEHTQTSVTKGGSLAIKSQWCVRSSTYKQDDAFLAGKTGSGMRPLGGWWLTINEDANRTSSATPSLII